jgi:hypothetical protein
MTRVTTDDVRTRSRTDTLRVPVADINTMESVACGFRQTMFEIHTDDAQGYGGMDSGAGLGTDFIQMTWGDRRAVVRGIDLLRAWVQTFDPDAAKRLPDGLGPQKENK